MARDGEEFNNDTASTSGFPKIQLPRKPTSYERSKAELEAKKRREAEETEAALSDFTKHFGGGSDTGPGSSQRAPFRPSGPPQRHFAASSSKRRTGPGSLDPPFGSPSSRRWDRSAESLGGPADGYLGASGRSDHHRTFTAADQAAEARRIEERLNAKQTILVSHLPPSLSKVAIESHFPEDVSIHEVTISRATDSSAGRKSMTAIVTFDISTTKDQIDRSVAAVNKKYVGYGFYATASRHLSTAVLNSNATSNFTAHSIASQQLPFGAQKPAVSTPYSRAPPPPENRFGPPGSVDVARRNALWDKAIVQVNVPRSLDELVLIHKTLEQIVVHGPFYEGVLLEQREVQQDEKWAWIWDARSRGGSYYRWRLWGILSRSGRSSAVHQNTLQDSTRIFSEGPGWSGNKSSLGYEYCDGVPDLIDDMAYDSSEEEDSGDEDGMPRYRREGEDRLASQKGPVATNIADVDEDDAFLNPLQKAKLMFLLANVGVRPRQLKSIHVNQIITFAKAHANSGREEIVDILVHNVLDPLAASEHLSALRGSPHKDEQDHDMDWNFAGNEYETKEDRNIEDTSDAMMVGIYLLTAIMSISVMSGPIRAWKYRQSIINALKEHHVFGKLGRVPRELGWGRMKTEKWKGTNEYILKVWDDQMYLDKTVFQTFSKEFKEPPLTAEETAEANARYREEEAAAEAPKRKSGWVKVNTAQQPTDEKQTSQVKQDGKSIEPKQELPANKGFKLAFGKESKPTEHPDAGRSGGVDDTDVVMEDKVTPVAAEQQARVPKRPRAEDMFGDYD